MKKSIVKSFVVFVASAVAAEASAITEDKMAELSDAYRQFSFDLFNQVEKKLGSEGNVVISPLSAWYALGMLQEGAATTTLAEINQALRLSPNFTDLAICNQQLTEQLMTPIVWDEWLPAEGIPALELANSFWADDEITCLDTYKEALQTYYQAEYAQLDLQLPESLDRVDDWVNEKTHGTIPSLNLEPNEMMRMLLVNALYFKAPWAEVFFEELMTDESYFTNADGAVLLVPMMHTSGLLAYGKTGGYQMVRISLGLEHRFSMTFFMGGEEAAPFGADVYAGVENALSYHNVHLSLPRFEADCEAVLNEPLQEMGMREAFCYNADLSRTSTDELHVSLVKQLTHIGVDEKGVEASAVTVIMEDAASIGEEVTYKEICFDHPFYFSIEDHLCNKVLFLGHVSTVDGKATHLEMVDEPSPSVIYDMTGRLRPNLSHGLNILNEGGSKQIVYVK